jgi:vacuolar-type H+-ATPase subunit F/Vma7
MTLTDAQIDRYSRQIIVPHIGGRGQERLLGARMLIAGDGRDIQAPLAYLIGAGVGAIRVKSSAGQVAFAETNPDVSITVVDKTAEAVDLALIIVGSEAARKIADEIARNRDVRALVIARLDTPGNIAVIPKPSTLTEGSLRAAFSKRSEAADLIAMLATVEAFKLLAGYARQPSPAIIEFDGFATSVRVLH